MYSKDDVEEILSELMTSVRDSVKRDLEATTSMSALVLEQVLSAADDGGVAVAVDMSKTEDSGSISRIRDLASAAGIGALGDLDVKRKNVVKLVRPAASTPPMRPHGHTATRTHSPVPHAARRPDGHTHSPVLCRTLRIARVSTLPSSSRPWVWLSHHLLSSAFRLQESMREEHNRLVADNLRLAEEAAALRERYEAMQAAASAANRDKADAVAKLQAAHAEATALRAGATEAAAASATASAHAAEIESLRSELARLHSQAEGAKVRLGRVRAAAVIDAQLS